ncbi:hypothetical protein Tco_0617145 [Tanacetum coccineum]
MSGFRSRDELHLQEEHNGLLEQECGSLKLKVTSLESIIAEKDRELSDLGASSSSLRSQNQSLVNQYMEALGNAFGRAIEKGMQEGWAAGIEHGQAGRCLSDLEAYNPSAEADFNSVVRDLCGLDFPLLRELFAKKDASTWDVMDLHHLDDAVAEVLGMTDLQPDTDYRHRRVRKMERNLAERLPLLRDVFVSIDHPVPTEVLTTIQDYENLHLADAVPGGVIPEPRGEGKVKGSSDADVGDLVLSQLEGEARDVVL